MLGLASFASADEELPTFDQIVLGENADLTAKIHFAYHRTDIPDKLNGYVAEFQKIYPNVEIEYELITDYAENALTLIPSLVVFLIFQKQVYAGLASGSVKG